MIVFFIIGMLLCVVPYAIVLMFQYSQFQDSEYKRETGYSFFKVIFDVGLKGEYLTVSKLSKVKGYHKTVVNVYLPKQKGGTTEIDVVFLHESGVYVIESKNYSGWIFGREEDKNWMQVMGKTKKSFYNPVKQNENHITHLISNVPNLRDFEIKSLIVFSERCTLKKIDVKNPIVSVFKRNVIAKRIASQARYSKADIDGLYKELKQFSNVTDSVKMQHIQSIQQRKQS